MWDEEIDARKIITVKYTTHAIAIRKPELQGFQQERGGQRNSPAISHQLTAYFSLEFNPVFKK